jgi:hypothetical protein
VFYFSAAVIAWDSKRADCDHEAFPFRFRSTAPPRRTQAAETISVLSFKLNKSIDEI